MKKKAATIKRLTLNRETLRVLEADLLREVKGGTASNHVSWCASCDSISCASECVTCVAD